MRLSRDPAARRRLAALVVAAFVALALGVAVGARPWSGEDGGGDAKTRLQRAGEMAAAGLTIEQQVGQLLVLSFPGKTLPPSVEAAFREGRAAGAVLFGGNVADAAQLKALTRRIQKATGGAALIATDQEGGDTRIVSFAPPAEPQSALATPQAAGEAAKAAAGDLRNLGININLAPVADVESPGAALGGRLYPGGADRVSAAVRSAVRAYREGRTGATLKHFPGFGAAGANTDDEPVTISLTRERLMRDLLPFRAGIGAGAPLVMVSHALYAAFDRRRIASQSSSIMRGLLRRDLGYEGVVITDSLEADAVLSRSSVATAAERSLESGADLLLLTGSGSYTPVRRRLVEHARRSPAFRARVREALARVNTLKRGLGLRIEDAGR